MNSHRQASPSDPPTHGHPALYPNVGLQELLHQTARKASQKLNRCRCRLSVERWDSVIGRRRGDPGIRYLR
jgi:hypothetical protein